MIDKNMDLPFAVLEALDMRKSSSKYLNDCKESGFAFCNLGSLGKKQEKSSQSFSERT